MAVGGRVRDAGFSVFTYFARHATAANLLMLVMLGMGIAAATQIRSQYFPDVVLDYVEVSVAWDGAGPEDVDAGIVAALQPVLLAVEGVESSEATSREGEAEIELSFAAGWDMGRAAADVETALAGVTTLPDGAEEPRVRPGQWRDRVTDVVIFGPLPVENLGRFADEFAARLYREGIARATIQGVANPVIRIAVPEAQLLRHDLSLREIADAIAAEAEAAPAGEVADGGARLRAGSERREVAEIGGLAIRADPDGETLRLRDVAEIDLEGADAGRAFFREGVPAVTLRIDRSDTGDSIAMQAIVQRVAAEFRPTLPEGVRIELIRTRAEGITDRIGILVQNFLQGLALVVGVLFLFLNARIAFWVAMGIPIAMSATIGLMYAFGLTINMMSLFGLILCLGLVVDDAIVVAEHADWRRRVLREPPVVAAETAAIGMALPVISSMITTVIAFYGLTFIGGHFGALIADIPFTVIVVLSASLIENFLILPHHLSGALAAQARMGWTDWIDAPSRAFNRGLDWFRARAFVPLMGWVIRLRYPVLAAALLLLAQSAALLIRGDVPWRFFNSPEQGLVTGNLAMLPGADRADTLAMVRELERAVAVVDARLKAEYGRAPVASALAQVGGTSGRGLAGDELKEPDQLGAIDVELIDPDLRPYSSAAFIEAVEAEVVRQPQVETLSFRSYGQGPAGDSLDVSFSGADARTLKAAAEALKAELAPLAIVSGLEDDLAYDQAELVLDLMPLGARLGFGIEEVGAELFARLDGIEAAEFAQGTRTATVRVGLPKAEITADFLSRTRLFTAEGAAVPLSDIVTIESRPGFSSVRRVDGQQVVGVTGSVSEDDPGAAAALARDLETTILPEIAARFGVGFEFGGLAAQEQEFLGDAFFGFGICLAGIYLVLAWVFESWLRPMVVMAIIPFGLIGTVWGHWQWGLPLSLFSVVGLIGMTGIIVNNSIVLIAAMDAQGGARATAPAVIAAAGDRLRPILLTSLTNLLGLGPLMFERSQQALFLKPTVITLVYGLGLGTLLVLLIVPALVVVEHDIRTALRGWRRAVAGGGRVGGLAAGAWLATLAGLGWLAVVMGPLAVTGAPGGPGAWLMARLPGLSAGWASLLALLAGLGLILAAGRAIGARARRA